MSRPLLVTFAFAFATFTSPANARAVDAVFTPEFGWTRLGELTSFLLPNGGGLIRAQRPDASWYPLFLKDCKRQGTLTVIDKNMAVCELTVSSNNDVVWMQTLGIRVPHDRDAISVVVARVGVPAPHEKAQTRAFVRERLARCLRFIDAEPGEEGSLYAGESVPECGVANDDGEVAEVDTPSSTTTGDATALETLQREQGRFTARAQAWERFLADQDLTVRISGGHTSYGLQLDKTYLYEGGNTKLHMTLCANGIGAAMTESFFYISEGYSEQKKSAVVPVLWFVGDDKRRAVLYTYFDDAWHQDSLGPDLPRGSVTFDGKSVDNGRSSGCTP
jgi:hypothetical protein